MIGVRSMSIASMSIADLDQLYAECCAELSRRRAIRARAWPRAILVDGSDGAVDRIASIRLYRTTHGCGIADALAAVNHAMGR